MYYSLSWYDVNHKLQENYCVDVILSLETADDVNSKSFPLDSADIHMKAMLQSGKTKNAANTTSIYESKTRIVNIFYNPYREQPSQSEVKKSQGWLVSASRAAHFYELIRTLALSSTMKVSLNVLVMPLSLYAYTPRYTQAEHIKRWVISIRSKPPHCGRADATV